MSVSIAKPTQVPSAHVLGLRRASTWVAASAILYGSTYLPLGVTYPSILAMLRTVGGAALIPVLILVGFGLRRRASHEPLARHRAAWHCLGLAFVLMLVSGAARAIAPDLQGWHLFQRALSFAFYATAIAAAVCLPNPPPSRTEGAKVALDGLMIAVSGGLVLWHGLLVGGQEDGHATWPPIALPLPDLLLGLGLLIAVAVALLRTRGGRRERSTRPACAALAAMLAGEVVQIVGGLPRLPWTLVCALGACLLVSLDLEHPAVEDASAQTPDFPWSGLQWLPYAAVLMGYWLLLRVAWGGADPHTFQLLAGAVALSVLIVTRQLISAHETLQLQREHATLSSEARYRSLVQHASDVVSIVDKDGVITFSSPAASTTLGHEPSELIGVSIFTLWHPDDTECARRRFLEVLETGNTYLGRWRIRRRDGMWIQTDNICTNLTHDENIQGIVITTRDISERCALEAQLLHQAFHDPLTGLANRALFLDRVRHALSRRLPGSEGLGVLFIDLDQFKTVNDSLGHQAGDQLLRGVAERLSGGLRAFDTIARIGGDEFAVLIDDPDHGEGVVAIADRVSQALRDPFVLDGREVVTTASIGVALAGANQGAEDLVRNADLAMYLAKNRGGRQTALFEPEMHVAMLTRLELQADLRRALERNEFSLVYQPVHALETQALVGVEALLRWNHPTRGSVPPAVFIPIAEQTGQIVAIGRWVIEHACRDAREWRRQLGDGAPQSVAVNISGRQIPDPALFGDIRAALAWAELPANALVLELTESVLLTHTDEALEVMHRLKALGVGLALDDFGTGYSSLSYLQRLPIDVLKIDRAFVDRLATDPGAQALTRSIVGLGKTLSLRTIAEGVESRAQAELLRSLGCEHAQGFLYGMPMPSSELLRYARRARKSAAA